MLASMSAVRGQAPARLGESREGRGDQNPARARQRLRASGRGRQHHGADVSRRASRSSTRAQRRWPTRCSAAIRTLSAQPIRYIINTSVDAEHTGGNDTLGAIGAQITGGNVAGQVGTDGAEIIAHEHVLERMTARSVQPPIPIRAVPQTTYHTDQLKLSTIYHGDGIQVFHAPAAHTDGDSLVYFRHNDVLVTGDVFTTTSYPVDRPRARRQHQRRRGRVEPRPRSGVSGFQTRRRHADRFPVTGASCDSADVAYYRDMVTIVRDRVQDMVKKGMTLDQVKAAKPTRDYDPRYGSTSGPWTTDMFVEAVYKSLSAKKTLTARGSCDAWRAAVVRARARAVWVARRSARTGASGQPRRGPPEPWLRSI